MKDETIGSNKRNKILTEYFYIGYFETRIYKIVDIMIKLERLDRGIDLTTAS